MTDSYVPDLDPPEPTPGPHAMKIPWPLRAALAILIIFGAVGTGLQIANASDQSNRDRSSSASANLSRCQSVVNANWRKAVAVLLVGYTTDGPVIDPATSVRLHLPRDVERVKAIGRLRITAALEDDARIDDESDRICPFVPSDPGRTPDAPVRSATAALERRLAHTH